jgi:acyl-coenzyme A thioesterase PaaI-like protein
MTTDATPTDLIPALDKLDARVLISEPNRIKVLLPLAGNANHLGTMYAGAIFSVAEFPFGLLHLGHFAGKPLLPVVGELTIRFLAPATTDVTVDLHVSDEEWQEMDDTTHAHGKSKFIREIEVLDADENVVAVAKATYFSILAG